MNSAVTSGPSQRTTGNAQLTTIEGVVARARRRLTLQAMVRGLLYGVAAGCSPPLPSRAPLTWWCWAMCYHGPPAPSPPGVCWGPAAASCAAPDLPPWLRSWITAWGCGIG